MRVLLRHARTGHYYCGKSEWVTSAVDARDFGSLETGAEIVAAENLDGMQLVVIHAAGAPEQIYDLKLEPQRAKAASREPPE